MDLEYIQNAYQGIVQFGIPGRLGRGIQILVVTGLLIKVIRMYLKGATETPGQHFGIKISDLYHILFLMVLVIVLPSLLNLTDQILTSIESGFASTTPPIAGLELENDEIMPPPTTIKAAIIQMASKLKPGLIAIGMSKVLGFFAWSIDMIIYPLFLAERFFMLGILRVFFPLVVGLSFIGKAWEDLLARYFKLYIAVYLIVPAFMLANVLINALYNGLTENVLGNYPTLQNVKMFAVLVNNIVMLFMIILKFKLYRKAGSFMFKLMGV